MRDGAREHPLPFHFSLEWGNRLPIPQHLAPCPAPQGAPRLGVDRVGDEAHRPVGEQELLTRQAPPPDGGWRCGRRRDWRHEVWRQSVTVFDSRSASGVCCRWRRHQVNEGRSGQPRSQSGRRWPMVAAVARLLRDTCTEINLCATMHSHPHSRRHVTITKHPQIARPASQPGISHGHLLRPPVPGKDHAPPGRRHRLARRPAVRLPT